MDNFEEQFLEQLAKARARLEGKEAYDDEAIAREYDPDAEPANPDYAAAENEVKTNAPKKEAPVAKKATSSTPSPQEVKKAEPKNNKPEKETTGKKGLNAEKLSVIWGAASVAIAIILSCLGLLIDGNSFAWQTFEAYMPFIGIVCGAASVICGALLIKDNKKGASPIFLGLLAILVAILMSSL